ncbi:MAG: hypothetical protein COB67_04555 [SAR324 cluster bacterium]|uniref:L-2-amino-thiazoline-4-carboxylic acid hydrolase n=1 Tax=SAR324 cluster bacterium TaxID=2024889 RepID=A0A2A4T6T9_9DELT|nr:MAG: hypothetical protein COB67_04555 [SAR324 cluster bacterium]
MEKKELQELLNKSWMTHDAMWFQHCLEECGIETTNRINKAAIHSAAAVEIKRFQQAFAIETIESFDDLKCLLKKSFEMIKVDFMDFEIAFPTKNTLRWYIHQCFAYEGIKRTKVIEQYQCGIFERLVGWLQGLGVQYQMAPVRSGCMMRQEGYCFREFEFNF